MVSLSPPVRLAGLPLNALPRRLLHAHGEREWLRYQTAVTVSAGLVDSVWNTTQ